MVKADEDTTLYFNIETGLMIRSDRKVISPQGEITSQTFQSNYQEVDGVKIPFDIRQLAAGVEVVMKTTGVEQNIEIDNAQFKKPE